MGLKSAHSQEFNFQESGEVDRFLKMGTHFQERSGSLENGLYVTWSGFWLCPRICCDSVGMLVPFWEVTLIGSLIGRKLRRNYVIVSSLYVESFGSSRDES